MREVTKVEPPRPLLSPHTLGFENGGRSYRRLELELPSHGGQNRAARTAALTIYFSLF